MNESKEKGFITLEACISVLTFLVLMLLLSSLFVMFMAQNVTAHVALQTSESLSLDVYSTEKLMKEENTLGTIGDNLGQWIKKMFGSSQKNPSFVTDDRWYNGESEDVAKAVKTRFIGYLAGGDETKADELLERMNIVDGIDGIDFSKSYVSGGVLYVEISYQLEYDFNIWDLGKIEGSQTSCSKLWK